MDDVEHVISEHRISEHRASPRTVVQVVIGTAAIAVAVIHASVIHVSGIVTTTRPVDGRLFLAAAIVGAACGVATLLHPTVEVLSVTVVAHGLFVLAWLLSRIVGLPLAGLHTRQPVGVADAIAAALSVVVVAGGAWLIVGTPSPRPVARFTPAFASILVVAISVPALLSATDAGSSSVVATRTATATTSTVAGEGTAGADAQLHGASHEHAAAPAKAFDPSQPIDLSGTPGVTQVQQKQAELLLAQTLAELPQFADPTVAEARGYHSIGDSLTGDEHFMNWAAISDGHVLDPNFPESLVYDTRSGKRVLEAAMFILPTGYTLDNVPQIGGSLIQWHIHDNLCFTEGAVPVVAGFHQPGQGCGPGRQAFIPTPMIHVWITKNPCGPFAALEGVGAGQVKAGDVHACDHLHGSGSSTF